MQLTLHHFSNSVCSEKVRMVLNEKSLSWESREVDLFKGEQFRPEYLRLNPKAVVPQGSMSFPGLRNEQQLKDLLAYLEKQKD